MARAPGASPLAHGVAGDLEPLLGRERLVKLEEVLLARAVEWGASVAPGRVHVAYEPAAAADLAPLRAMLGAGVDTFVQSGAGARGRLANAAVRALEGGDGPLLIAWPDLPRWRPEHAESALTDLADGCDVSVGPVFDGGFYLLAVARLLPAVFGVRGETWRSADAMAVVLGAANAAGIEGGMLRAERGLHSRDDVRAALADPLLDDQLRALLASGA